MLLTRHPPMCLHLSPILCLPSHTVRELSLLLSKTSPSISTSDTSLLPIQGLSVIILSPFFCVITFFLLLDPLYEYSNVLLYLPYLKKLALYPTTSSHFSAPHSKTSLKSGLYPLPVPHSLSNSIQSGFCPHHSTEIFLVKVPNDHHVTNLLVNSQSSSYFHLQQL